MINEAFVAGVDGCRGGWLVVLRPLDDPAAARTILALTFRDILAIEPQPSVIAVDMPIGLPERAGAGGRAADVAARAHLGGRQSAVFSVPARSAVSERDYREACSAAFAASDPPRKVSKQIYHLFPKIREIDDLMTPMLQERVMECHPEASFWAMNGGTALDLPKKVKSRPNPAGIEARRCLLQAAGYPDAIFCRAGWSAAAAGADDLVDAAAASWTAARIATGAAQRFPADPPRDKRGLRMEIWA